MEKTVLELNGYLFDIDEKDGVITSVGTLTPEISIADFYAAKTKWEGMKTDDVAKKFGVNVHRGLSDSEAIMAIEDAKWERETTEHFDPYFAATEDGEVVFLMVSRENLQIFGMYSLNDSREIGEKCNDYMFQKIDTILESPDWTSMRVEGMENLSEFVEKWKKS